MGARLPEPHDVAINAEELTAVDLFAGGGGLSVGLKAAKFKVTAAVESFRPAAETFEANHPDTVTLTSDIRDVTGKELLATSAAQSIDLIAGCPPCQGFTSLTAKWKRDDPRNELISEMGRLVSEVLPTAVMMENVPGLTRKGSKRLDEFINLLEAELGYIVRDGVLQVADYGVPQVRRRYVLFAGRGFEIALPPASHSKTGRDDLPKWNSVSNVLKDQPEPSVYKSARLREQYNLDSWHLVRRMSKANELRLRHAKPGKDWRLIPEDLRPACHRGSYFGFRNVYGRMSWDQPSPTITSGCTSFSKGRFGHPEADRTISVKEAALIQQFPSDYLIKANRIDDACSIIGNALPCGFAAIMAKAVAAGIQNHLKLR